MSQALLEAEGRSYFPPDANAGNDSSFFSQTREPGLLRPINEHSSNKHPSAVAAIVGGCVRLAKENKKKMAAVIGIPGLVGGFVPHVAALALAADRPASPFPDQMQQEVLRRLSGPQATEVAPLPAGLLPDEVGSAHFSPLNPEQVMRRLLESDWWPEGDLGQVPITSEQISARELPIITLYRFTEKDTIPDIAYRFGVQESDIIEANIFDGESFISPGNFIVIPDSTVRLDEIDFSSIGIQFNGYNEREKGMIRQEFVRALETYERILGRGNVWFLHSSYMITNQQGNFYWTDGVISIAEGDTVAHEFSHDLVFPIPNSAWCEGIADFFMYLSQGKTLDEAFVPEIYGQWDSYNVPEIRNRTFGSDDEELDYDLASEAIRRLEVNHKGFLRALNLTYHRWLDGKGYDRDYRISMEEFLQLCEQAYPGIREDIEEYHVLFIKDR